MKQEKTQTFPFEIKKGSVRVKIYRTVDRGRPRFTLAYHDGPRRILRQFADLSEAKREGSLIAEKLNAGQGSALELTGLDRESYLHAMRKLKPLDIPLAPAIDEYVSAKALGAPLLQAAELYIETQKVKLQDVSVPQVYQELLVAARADGGSVSYLHDLKSRLGHFARDFKDSIARITTADLNAWLRSLKFSKRSRNNHRRAIVTLFNFAKSAGYLNPNINSAAENTASVKKDPNAIDVFTPAEFSELLKAADKITLPYFVLGGLCGLRTSEILRLNWEDVRWAEQDIVIRAAIAKTRRRRVPPLSAAAAAWLEPWKASTGPVITIKQPEHRVKDICAAAGVTWRRNGLRHSFITYRVAMEKDFVKVAYEAGNSPAMIKSNYDAVATEKEGRAWFAIMPKMPGNVVGIAAVSL